MCLWKKDCYLLLCVYFKYGWFWYVKGGKWNDFGMDMVQVLVDYVNWIVVFKGGMVELIEKVYLYYILKVVLSMCVQYCIVVDVLKGYFVEFVFEQVKGKYVVVFKFVGVVILNMINCKFFFLWLVFQYVVEWQLVDLNLCIGIKCYEEVKCECYFVDDEFFVICDVVGLWFQVIFDLFYLIGQWIIDVLCICKLDIIECGIMFKQQKIGVKLCVLWMLEMCVVVECVKGFYGNVMVFIFLYGCIGKVLDYCIVLFQWYMVWMVVGIVDVMLYDLCVKVGIDVKYQGGDVQVLFGYISLVMIECYIRFCEMLEVIGLSFRQVLDVG